ncbi:MAG: glutaredoxin family protein [candidate division KSB1 bacterium]|nr:glutaredoxin family protein [candidate division KSB1 bacterium]
MTKPSDCEPIRVEIYGKADCHLCEVVKKKVLQFTDEFAIEMIDIDITSDPLLEKQYAERIP